MSIPGAISEVRRFFPEEGLERNEDMLNVSQDTGYASKQSEAGDSTMSPSEPLDAPPDGGFAAWLVVLGAWCTSFCSFGWLNSAGIFQEYYEFTLLKSYTASEIAWIPSLQIFFMLGMGPIVGKLSDSYGPRWLLLVGSFLHVFGLMMASLSKTYYQLLLSQGICSAIGVSAIFQPAFSAVGEWFDGKKGAAFGILSTGSSLGGVIFPIMISHLMARVGYGWAMRIGAFLILFLLTIANLTVRSRITHRPDPIEKRFLTRPFHDSKTVLLLVGEFLLTFGIFIPLNNVVVEARAARMSASLSEYLLPILNSVSLLGRLSAGILADRIGRYNVFVFVCFLAGVLTLALWLPASGNPARIVFAALFGFFSGAYVSLTPALVVQISPPKEIGFRIGVVFLFCSFSGLTANPIAGAILEHENRSYRGMKIFGGVCCIVGVSFVAAVRFYHTGLKLLAKF